MDEKTCENCKFFRRYYVRYRLRFFVCDTGLCMRYRKKKMLEHPFKDSCSRWEIKEDDEEWRKELAPRAILAVYERLEELAALLRDE